MTSSIQYTIAGKNYVLIEFPMLPNIDGKKFDEEVKRLDIVFQGLIILRYGWLFNRDILSMKLLVPENKLIEFNNLKLTK